MFPNLPVIRSSASMTRLFAALLGLALLLSTPPSSSALAGPATRPTFENVLEDARKGDGSAMRDVAKRLLDGDGVDKNSQEGFSWILKAAEAGNALAMNDVAICFAVGDGTTKDLAKALFWYRKGADAG